MKATWNNEIIAESDATKVVENNHYFPPESIKENFLKASESRSQCPWKGEAHYYTVSVDGKENIDAAWFYPDAKEDAKHIEDYVAFWKGVKVSD